MEPPSCHHDMTQSSADQHSTCRDSARNDLPINGEAGRNAWAIGFVNHESHGTRIRYVLRLIPGSYYVGLTMPSMPSFNNSKALRLGTLLSVSFKINWFV